MPLVCTLAQEYLSRLDDQMIGRIDGTALQFDVGGQDQVDNNLLGIPRFCVSVPRESQQQCCFAESSLTKSRRGQYREGVSTRIVQQFRYAC